MKATTAFSPPACRTSGGRTSRLFSRSTAKAVRPVRTRLADCGHSQCRRLSNTRPSRRRPLLLMVRPFLEVPDLAFTDAMNLGRIPVPQIGQTSPSANLTTSAERKVVRCSLEEISRNSMKHQNGPRSLQDVRHSVDMLLDGESLPEL